MPSPYKLPTPVPAKPPAPGSWRASLAAGGVKLRPEGPIKVPETPALHGLSAIGHYDVSKDMRKAYGDKWKSEYAAADRYRKEVGPTLPNVFDGLVRRKNDVEGRPMRGAASRQTHVARPTLSELPQSLTIPVIEQSGPLSRFYLQEDYPPGDMSLDWNKAAIGVPDSSGYKDRATEAVFRENGYPAGYFAKGKDLDVADTLTHEARHYLTPAESVRQKRFSPSAARAEKEVITGDRSILPLSGTRPLALRHGLDPHEQLGWATQWQRDNFKDTGARVTTKQDARRLLDRLMSEEYPKHWNQEAARGINYLKYLKGPDDGTQGDPESRKRYLDGWLDYLSDQMPGMVRSGGAGSISKVASLAFSLGQLVQSHA